MTLNVRLQRLQALLAAHTLDAVVLNASPSLTYLTGLHVHLSERPVLGIFPANGNPALVLPELEAGKLSLLPFTVEAFPYGENPADWPKAVQAALQACRLARARIGVEPQWFRFLELQLLEQAALEVRLLPAEAVLAQLRAQKDAAEVAAIRRALAVAWQALEATLPVIRPDITEREVAAELTLQLLRAGSDPELPFSPIVAFGPSSANPHAVPGDRPLKPPALILIDWGARVEGYCADLTRMFAIGSVESELMRITEIVLAANEAARARVAPNVPARTIDEAARQVITQAGYGPYFVHRTGHGLGLEVHEPPYLRSDNTVPLRPGMVFTVEPGIYLTGRGGARIEDDVLVTENGAETLSPYPRALRQLD
ncbi:M24 family metallopeptidase [Rhodothermus bifroesti]|uniref:Aminopeptidase P family protein n=1 Tax=Rhodothermus marinus TaxID=29549 RepID=A0A7V2AYG7_RHOMR|nr:Xaa-Pro peptidase family protein [Rhodothermus bifroesti]